MRRVRPLSALIMIAWLFMMGLLVRREYFSSTPLWQPGVAMADTGRVEWWSGIYIGGEKIGYAYTNRVSEGDSLFRVASTQLLRLTTLGQIQVINVRSEATLNSDLSLRSFSFAMNTDDAASSLTAPSRQRSLLATSFEVQGGVDGRRLRLIVRQGGTSRGREQTITLDGPVYMDAGLDLLIGMDGFEVGEVINVPTFDPATLGIVPTEIRVAALDTIEWNGQEVPAYRLETEYFGFIVKVWVNEAGEELRGEVPMGSITMSTQRESRDQAVNEGWNESTALDLVNLAAIPAGVMKIVGARQADSMRVRLKGIDPSEFDLTFGRQELIEQIIEVKKEDMAGLAGYELPNEERTNQYYLRSTPFVQADAYVILNRARRLRRQNREAISFAEELVHYVYNYLDKVPTVGVPNALEVFQRRAGDCNEHTVLFTALARAAGLPALMNAGVVYLDGQFYYHAWPSVWLGEWVAVDPTFDQFPADATHISFVRGGLDRQIELMKIIGRLSIDVVSYHPVSQELRP